MVAKGIIRKISIGDIKEGITYKVGQFMLGNTLLIEQILLDLDSLETHGFRIYDVYVSDQKNNVRIWKSFENVPTSVEYDISLEKDESI